MIVVVTDTSVYVSALVFGGIPRAALTAIMLSPYRLAVSVELQAELADTLGNKFGWAPKRVADAGHRLWADALWCKPAKVRASRDPDDDHVLGCAVSADAQLLVTGDKDLLTLHPYNAIAIVTPSQFLAIHAERAKAARDDRS